MSFDTVHGILEHCAELYYDKTAFIGRRSKAYSFGELLMDSRLVAAELISRGLAGQPAAIIGEVGYGGLAAMFGCQAAGCPFVPINHSLGQEEHCRIISEYEISVVFCTARYLEQTEEIARKIPGLTILTDVEGTIASADKMIDFELPPIDPSEPAFMFLTENGGAMLSHRNICASIEAVANIPELGSYTFLSPTVWGEAFDCIMGLLLPLSAGCCVMKRGERRGVTRAISESGATALTCTPQRLRNLERSLRSRSEKKRSKAEITLSNVFNKLGRIIGLDLSKRMHRHVHSLLGDNLKLILCGGAYPEKESVRQFTDWGMDVYSYYYIPECGPLAVSEPGSKKLMPLAELSVPSPIKDGMGELCVGGDRIPMGYFGGKTDFGTGFPTGDVASLLPDGFLELRGRKKTMFYDKSGAVIFPEELISVIRKNRYVSDCSITGRFDTRAGDVIITAHITPDLREVNAVLGDKYSPNRLRLFFNRVTLRLEPELPHKIHEFKLPD